MIKNDFNSGISKSLSLSSLSIQQTDDNSILTLTKSNEKSSTIIANSKRRKAVLPTPHKPQNEHDLLIMNTKHNSCNDKQIAKVKENRIQVDDEDVWCEFGNTTNGSFVCCPNILFNIDSNDNVENSVVYQNSYRQNKFDEVNKFDQSLNQREYCRKMNTQNFLKRNSNIYDKPENDSQSEDEKNNESFDKFIFKLYSFYRPTKRLTVA